MSERRGCVGQRLGLIGNFHAVFSLEGNEQRLNCLNGIVPFSGCGRRKRNFLKTLTSQQPRDLRCSQAFWDWGSVSVWTGKHSKTIPWTENVLSVFGTKTPFSNLSSVNLAFISSSFN